MPFPLKAVTSIPPRLPYRSFHSTTPHSASHAFASASTSSSSSSSSSSSRTSSTPHNLTFPTKPYPTPLEIFHLDPKEPTNLTNVAIKSRFLELARLYHPDLRSAAVRLEGKGKGKEKETDEEFKQIVLAYELLKDPSKRSLYLHSGIGWHSTDPNSRRRRGGGNPFAGSSGVYDFTRGRPMKDQRSWGNGTGSYNWDHGPDWADPHNPHFRPSYSSSSSSSTSSSSTWSGQPGWTHQGTFSTNGTIFLLLLSITTFLIPLSYWSALPAELLPRNDFTREEWREHTALIGGGKHAEAARNLERARREAKVGGKEKREAIKRRVRQLEMKRAYERAMEVQRIESMGGTGHLQLPAPTATPPTAASIPIRK